MKASDIFSPDFDPYQPIPHTLNLGWAAIEEHILRYHNRYFGREKHGKVTPVFEDGNFTGIHVTLDADDLQDERTLLYDPTTFVEVMHIFCHNRLAPGGRRVITAKWYHNGTTPTICLQLAGTQIPKPMPVVQEVLPTKKPQSKVEERFARYYAEHEATEAISC